jgi:hypothetical protein
MVSREPASKGIATPMAVMRNLFSSDDGGRLFEPDTVVAAQFYATFKGSPYKEPELRLMAAVLEDAISCLSIKKL